MGGKRRRSRIKRGARPRPKRRRGLPLAYLVGGLLALGLVLAGAAGQIARTGGATTAGRFPSYVGRGGARTVRAYEIATDRPDLLGRLACYCGCVGNGHQALSDCFVAGTAEDGTITYDAHGAGCLLCVDEAIDAAGALQQGMTLKEIRAQLDGAYSRFGPGTNTPPIP